VVFAHSPILRKAPVHGPGRLRDIRRRLPFVMTSDEIGEYNVSTLDNNRKMNSTATS